MNRKTQDELTITDKLQHLPLPDLENAIWARVKAQLDLDLPTDDDGGDGPGAPTGGSGWMWGSGLFILVAALVAVFFFRNNNQPQTVPSNTVQTTSPSTIPTQQPQQTTGPPTTLPQNDGGPQTAAPTGVSPGVVFQPPVDSLAVEPNTALPLRDSQQQTAVITPPPVQADTINTAKPKPKAKGVTGLTDNDYRIVPSKRDSL